VAVSELNIKKDNLSYVENPLERARALWAFREIEKRFPGKVMEPEFLPTGIYVMREIEKREITDGWGFVKNMIENSLVDAIINQAYSEIREVKGNTKNI
jgi:hypothetical protein